MTKFFCASFSLPLVLLAPACTAEDDGGMDDVAETEDGDTTSDASTSDSEESGDASTSETASDDTTSESAGTEETATTDTNDPVTCVPTDIPTNGAELLPWLEGQGYADWHAESGPHASSGPHFGTVRTFVDICLYESLDQGHAEHPVGSAAVKELYGDGDEVLGYSVMVKVAEGSGGDTWYWYENYQGSVFGDDVGAGICTGCHGSGGVDYFLSPFPLQ